MDDHEWRTQRRQELVSTAPLGRLIALYRHSHGLSEFEPLPDTMTYEALIEAILDREGIARLSGPDTTNN
jgi:hypothetical protein